MNTERSFCNRVYEHTAALSHSHAAWKRQAKSELVLLLLSFPEQGGTRTLHFVATPAPGVRLQFSPGRSPVPVPACSSA